MPPKAKFTKEEIVSAALEITKTEGICEVTARSVGERLGSSARPIFTVFNSMDEVRQQVIQAAKALYNQYIRDGLLQVPAFKGVGMQYIRFAVNEPKLFRLLFMSESIVEPDLSEVLPLLDDNYRDILLSITEAYKVSQKEAVRLYRHLWIYTHGIASLCATQVCRFGEEEINGMITEIFVSLLQKIKEENGND